MNSPVGECATRGQLPLETSIFTIATASPSTSEITSSTPVSSTSTNASAETSALTGVSVLSLSSSVLSATYVEPASIAEHDPALEENQQRVRLCTQKTDYHATVVLDGNTAISVDRAEFAVISPYFRAAFYGGFSEARSKLLRFESIKVDHFLRCCVLLRLFINKERSTAADLQWMTLQQALEMLDVASYLLVDPLLTLLSDVIVSKVNADTLVLAYHRAEYRYVPLAQKLWKAIVRQYDRLLQNNTFLMLSEGEILRLLRDRHLNIDRNAEKLMVQKWIEAYKFAGSQQLREEMECANELAGFSKEPRLPNSILVASGGWSNVGPTMLVEALDIRSRRWIRSELKLFELPRAYHAVINTSEHLYTVGGFNGEEYYRSTRKFNLSTKECVEVAPMYDQRCYVACAQLDEERIIAFGGYNNYDRLRTAEIFHIPTNQWHRVAEMSSRRSDGHCVKVNNFVYAIGGFDGVNCHSTVEYYDMRSDRWWTLAKNMTSRRSGVGAANMERVIIVCGGFDGTSRLQSCEFLDEREGKWHVLKSMNRPRSNFGIEVLGNEVVVAGGYGGIVGTIDDTEAYDFRANAWKELPKMGLRRSAVYLTKIEYHDIIEAFVRPKPLNY